MDLWQCHALENDVLENLYRQWDDHIKRDYNHLFIVLASAENELMLTAAQRGKYTGKPAKTWQIHQGILRQTGHVRG